MARMRNAQPKDTSGSYERLFGNADLGALVSKVQSAVIASGYELEKLIVAEVTQIPNLDALLRQEVMLNGVQLARKNQIKQSEIVNFDRPAPDFMVFKRRNDVQTCHIIELKDGHVFDTKKARAEREAMQNFIELNAEHIPYELQVHFCAFNQNDRRAIYDGFKQCIAIEEAMTGREFCELLEIDYDAIVEARRVDGPDNVEFLLSELVNIEPIRQRLVELLG